MKKIATNSLASRLLPGLRPKLLPYLCVLALTACGARGPLTMPPGPAPEPLLGNPKPVKPASKPTPKIPSPADVSTAPNERTQ